MVLEQVGRALFVMCNTLVLEQTDQQKKNCHDGVCSKILSMLGTKGQ